MNRIVIVSAVRSAVGSFLGTLSGMSAVDIGSEIIKAALTKSSVSLSEVDEVITGQVLTAGMGQNPARQAAILAGCHEASTALTINQVCGSGLRAVAMGYQSIINGDAHIVVAGGQENMSLSQHALYARSGAKMGDVSLVDTMIKDGLWDAFNNYHMGITAENIASQFQISREEQDEFSFNSQLKASQAQKNGYFKEQIVPITISSRKGDIVFENDEFIRHDATLEGLGKLRPAFDKAGTVTAGNASGLNDGAAYVVLMSETEANKRGLKPLAVIQSWATSGVSPKIMGTGPVPASQKALQKAGWTHEQLDLIEANEAFAAQAISVNKQMGWDTNKVNVNGGAIAIGHPIGASGARVLVGLLHEMARRDVRKGLATLCIGGGMGIALCVEKS
jgi:acetyl-CoA C-acetyltransferase